MERRDYIDLLELQNRIKESIADAFPGRYWVKAEISSWSPRANGHCYLSLSQSRGGKAVAEARAMIWKWHYPALKAYFEESTGQPLQAGITVLVRVQVSFSELYGIALYVDEIDPAFTLGAQALERKRTLERLTAGGYLEMQQELLLPRLPRRLAVVTSLTAAGYGDFRRHLLENPDGYAFTLDLYEALMQGEQAPASIIAAILDAQEHPYDALLILRGGGSEQDLSCFDDFELAVAIATCPLPVVTAIGHDRDVHIADMVANRSVKTPTALADLFLERFADEDAALQALQERIRRGLLTGVHLREQRAEALLTRIGTGLKERLHREERRAQQQLGAVKMALLRRHGALENALQKASGRVSRGLTRKWAATARLTDAAVHRLRFAATSRVSQAVSAIALKEALIKASDPRNILSLGYVLVTGKDNKVLKTVNKVSRGDRIGVRFTDGSLTAKVDEVYTETLDNNKVNIA